MNQNQLTRRQLLQLSAGLGAASLLAACVAAPGRACSRRRRRGCPGYGRHRTEPVVDELPAA